MLLLRKNFESCKNSKYIFEFVDGYRKKTVKLKNQKPWKYFLSFILKILSLNDWNFFDWIFVKVMCCSQRVNLLV